MARAFVLVHGMSHGAWCWDLIRERLLRRGHHAVAVDLPGHGRRAADWRQASLTSYARAVADAIIREGIHDAVLVGHSMAGAVIPKAAELVPTRLAHLVFLAAVVLPSGSSLLETQLSPAARALFTGGGKAAGGMVRYAASFARARWMGDLPPGDERIAAALVQLTPEPLRPWRERVDLTSFYASSIPRTYVRCLRDEAVPPARAADYAKRLGVTPIDLDSDHSPMLSHPDELVRLLEKV